MVVTKQMLVKKIAEVNRHAQYQRIGTGTSSYNALDDEGTVLLFVKRIVSVEGEYVVTDDNVKARLFCPMPCLHWKCITQPDSKGVSKLRKPVEGLFIDDGVTSYCLGVSGASDEFEVRFQVGTSEVRLNSEFLNLVAPHLVINGLEEK